ncbi:MAG TPA: bifunctional adenosylcobinamide kinase/adenosylcobinamide-phosphate guanylyltransferase [Bryobacterales bacterium]|nr:bifunctional adenosylcobinamide kinase/adenosylcobinamide-phosphate guanylyltransferase [Bryobacterales bacterium]
MARVILILGGARSGKSRHAESLAEAHAGRRVYVATAEAGDEEMARRIAIHQARRGEGWRTVEEPLELIATLRAVAAGDAFVLVDCVTLWLSNLMRAGRSIGQEVTDLCEILPALPGHVCLVSNEVGLGIVPDTPLGRCFRDEAGFVNQMLAQTADEALFMVAGLPLRLK